MIKEAIEKIISLAENKTYAIGKDTYSDRNLVRIAPHIDKPSPIEVSGLDSAVKLIKTELQRIDNKIFVHVVSPREVSVFTTYTEDFSRYYLYNIKCDTPCFRAGFRLQQQALIELRSQFIENEGSKYLLDLLSKITNENSVASNDNGVTQTVETKQGIALAAKVTIKPRVKLAPYRTFLEIAQPESEFLLRLDECGNIGLIEADGGMWGLSAKGNIKGYFEEQFKGFDRNQDVIITM